MRRRLKLRVPLLLLFCSSILLSSLPGLITAAVVTLDSIEIYNTHEFLGSAPEVYFQCKGENRTTYLPDVKKKHALYAFKGEESWQLAGTTCEEEAKEDEVEDIPICIAWTVWLERNKRCFEGRKDHQNSDIQKLEEKKCKRCGIYEKDSFIMPDDVFDEWEFCASDFTSPDGKYIHFKEKEFNATFLCQECVPLEGASNNTDGPRNKEKGMHWVLVLLICVLVTSFVVLGAVTAYKYWQKRKKQQEQARFLKLFEESDDIEDELGIGPLSHVI